MVPFGEPKANLKARDDGRGSGKGVKEGLEGIQENLRIAKEAKRELEGIEEDQEEVLRGGGPRRGGIVRERRKKFDGGRQMRAEISKKIELIEESEYNSESGPEERLSSGQFAAFVAASNSKGTQKGTPNVGTPIPGTPSSMEGFPPSLRGPHRGRGGRGGVRSISSGRVKVAQAYDAVSASMRGKIHKDVATMVERLQSVETQTTDTRSASTGIEKGELDSLANEKAKSSPKKHVKVIRSIFEPFPDDWYDTADVLLHDPLVLAGRRSKSPVPTSRRYPPPRTPTPKRNREEMTPPPLPQPPQTKRVIAGMEQPITKEVYARERDDDSPKQQISVTDHFDTLLATIEAEEEEAKKRRLQRKIDAAKAADREIKKLGIDFDNRLAPSVASASAKKTAANTVTATGSGQYTINVKNKSAEDEADVAATSSKDPAVAAASRGKQP